MTTVRKEDSFISCTQPTVENIEVSESELADFALKE